jgi:hypothetical protein
MKAIRHSATLFYYDGPHHPEGPSSKTRTTHHAPFNDRPSPRGILRPFDKSSGRAEISFNTKPREITMKPFLILFMAMAIGTAAAEPAHGNQSIKKSAKTETIAAQPPAAPVLTKPVTTNTVVGRRATYSGVVVQIIKTDQPLLLLDPFAPESYGSGEGNILRDPFKRNSDAIKILSISF